MNRNWVSSCVEEEVFSKPACAGQLENGYYGDWAATGRGLLRDLSTIFLNFKRWFAMSVLIEFAMFPTDKGESVSAYVSQIVAMIRDSGVDYQLTPMGTIIETEELSQATDLVNRAYGILDQAGCSRVFASLKLDIRNGKAGRLEAKVDSIRNKIGSINT